MGVAVLVEIVAITVAEAAVPTAAMAKTPRRRQRPTMRLLGVAALGVVQVEIVAIVEEEGVTLYLDNTSP